MKKTYQVSPAFETVALIKPLFVLHNLKKRNKLKEKNNVKIDLKNELYKYHLPTNCADALTCCTVCIP